MKIKKRNKSIKIDSYFCTSKCFSLKKSKRIIALCLLPLIWMQSFPALASPTQVSSKISFKIEDITLPQAITKLQEAGNCVINYDKNIFAPGHRVKMELKEVSLTEALKRLLTNTRVTFKAIDANTIILYKLPDPVKPGRVTGKVVDEKGEFLPGVTIRVVETGQGAQTAPDGNYTLTLDPGTYTLEFSYISYLNQRVSSVVVKSNAATPLNIAMKPSNASLKEVIVTSTYRKASIEGLLTRQKNASEITNGISAEQLIRTPDRNIGESLKRISGVSTVDNKFVVVRGIGERYNAAMLDGVNLPSTEAQTRNFSFDLIPSNLVDNVVVSKTVTPDMNASFGGGLVQINTKDIPTENFYTLTAGTSYNDQSTGKEFLGRQRGKYDYLGFDDDRRDYPKDLYHTSQNTAPNQGLPQEQYQQRVDEQSKRFTRDNLSVYKYKAAPSQNYQFTMGKLFQLDSTGKQLGFTAALSYRNSQNINQFDNQRRGGWLFDSNNQGKVYDFNTSLGGILNVGLQLGKNRFSVRNTYTHVYDDALVRTVGYDQDNGGNSFSNGLPPNYIEEVNDPTYITLLQNKLSGQHQLGRVKVDWNLAKTAIDRKEKDLGITASRPVLVGDDYRYFYFTTPVSEPRIDPLSRHNYHNKENNYSWNVDGSSSFTLGKIKSTIKTGYFGIQRKGSFDWQIASLVSNATLADSLRLIPLREMVNPQNFGINGYNYAVGANGFLGEFEGKSQTHAGYLMLDNRLLDKLRLVWGLRTEYYKYTEIKNDRRLNGSEFTLPPEKAWQWLPSANLTYSPNSRINIRAAISSSVIRPELMDNSQFFRYDPKLGNLFGNLGLSSTRINSYDLKTEWFPGLGEIISAGGFYKKFDKPAELSFIQVNGNPNYYISNAAKADVYGLEFELRKNLEFIYDSKLLHNLFIYGNVTLQKSEVIGRYQIANPDKEAGGNVYVESKQKRSMYGQSPYLINGGIQYTGDHFGFNVMYNKAGYKTYIVSSLLDQIEYEKPREQIDAQVSYKFLKNKLEIRLNAGNLLNAASTFFINNASYEVNPDYTDGSDQSNAKRLKPGFTNKYEDGDQIRFSQRFGRTYSTTLTYNF